MAKLYRAVAKWQDHEHLHEFEYVGPSEVEPTPYEIQDYLYECYGHMHLEGLSAFYVL